jgi:hypothetical protein
MANAKEIFGSLFMMFGIMITIGATLSMMFFSYMMGGPYLTQIFISFAVLLIGLSVLIIGIILNRLSIKSVEVEASRTYKSTTRMIGIYLTIYGALITPPGILLWTASIKNYLIMVMGIVILVIGIVLLIVGKKR